MEHTIETMILKILHMSNFVSGLCTFPYLLSQAVALPGLFRSEFQSFLVPQVVQAYNLL